MIIAHGLEWPIAVLLFGNLEASQGFETLVPFERQRFVAKCKLH